MVVAAVVVIVTYIGIAFTRLPKVNIDRPSAAFTGAVLMVLLGVITFEQAVTAIDFNTIALLLGMMVLVVVLQKAGFFTLLAVKSISMAGTPRRLLVIVVVSTAVASAFLINDIVVLLFTPVVINACRMMRVNPVPYLVGEAMASNTGSAATMIGNPQNMLIGISSGISFTRFFLHLLPIATLSTAALLAVLFLFYGRQLGRQAHCAAVVPQQYQYNRNALRFAVPILGLAVVLFFCSSWLKLELPLIALGVAALSLLVGGIRPSEVIRGVDWVLLLFFAGLFIVIAGAYEAGIFDRMLEMVSITPDMKGVLSLTGFSVVVSQLTSNVPLTMLLLPVLSNTQGDLLWITLAATATLGGNLTIIGAVANIIVAEEADRDGVRLKFWEFFRVGALVTAVTVAIAVLVILAQYELGVLS